MILMWKNRWSFSILKIKYPMEWNINFPGIFSLSKSNDQIFISKLSRSMRIANSVRIFYEVKMLLNKMNNVNFYNIFFSSATFLELTSWIDRNMPTERQHRHHHHTHSIHVNQISIKTNNTFAHPNQPNKTETNKSEENSSIFE